MPYLGAISLPRQLLTAFSWFAAVYLFIGFLGASYETTARNSKALAGGSIKDALAGADRINEDLTNWLKFREENLIFYKDKFFRLNQYRLDVEILTDNMASGSLAMLEEINQLASPIVNAEMDVNKNGDTSLRDVTTITANVQKIYDVSVNRSVFHNPFDDLNKRYHDVRSTDFPGQPEDLEYEFDEQLREAITGLESLEHHLSDIDSSFSNRSRKHFTDYEKNFPEIYFYLSSAVSVTALLYSILVTLNLI